MLPHASERDDVRAGAELVARGLRNLERPSGERVACPEPLACPPNSGGFTRIFLPRPRSRKEYSRKVVSADNARLALPGEDGLIVGYDTSLPAARTDRRGCCRMRPHERGAAGRATLVRYARITRRQRRCHLCCDHRRPGILLGRASRRSIPRPGPRRSPGSVRLAHPAELGPMWPRCRRSRPVRPEKPGRVGRLGRQAGFNSCLRLVSVQ